MKTYFDFIETFKGKVITEKIEVNGSPSDFKGDKSQLKRMIAQAKEHGGIIWLDTEEPNKISFATDEDDFEDFPGWKALGQGHIKIIFADEG